jgi:hypothetical protein
VENADIIAKNLLENKVCTGCKFYNPDSHKCNKFRPVTLSSVDDVEVYLNGYMLDENSGYVIKDKTVHILQHSFDGNIINQTNGYNQFGMNLPEPSDKVKVVSRTIKDEKINKESHVLKVGTDLPQEETCIDFLDTNKVINHRS